MGCHPYLYHPHAIPSIKLEMTQAFRSRGITTMPHPEPPAVPPLTDYFAFLSDNDIRVKGTRIGIEHILYEYIHNAKTAEAIANQFPTVTLEQVYATILYYLQNKAAIGQYLSDWLDYTLTAEAAQDNHPDPGIQRLKALKASSAA